METSEVNRLLAEAVAKHGIRLDPDDPAMVVVTLNRLMLEEASKRVAEEIRAASREFMASAAKVESGLGAALARELKRNQDRAVGGRSAELRWAALGMVIGLLLFVGGVLVGRVLR